MATTTGLVDCVLVLETFGGCEIDTGGGIETLLIWNGGNPNVVESMWGDLLSDAAANGREVEVTHPNASALINGVRINRTP